MALSRDSKAERKWKLYRRTEFRLKQGLERIDFEEDILIPEIEALKSGRAIPGVPAGAAFDITVIDEVPNPSAEQGTSSRTGPSSTAQNPDETTTDS